MRLGSLARGAGGAGLKGGARILKVGRTHQCRIGGAFVRVPLIRLSEKWLAGAGLAEGDSISVRVAEGAVTITREGTGADEAAVQWELFASKNSTR